jgi:uncharacterized membrane protein HdeD (DUF308 family)
MNDMEALQSTDVLAARQASKDSIVFGALLLVLGIFVVLAPMFTGIGVTVLIGMLLIATGIVEIISAFKAGSFGKGVLRFLIGGLGIVAGGIIFATPVQSLSILTIVLAVFFVAGGIINIILWLQIKSDEAGGWALFSGILSILLGILIFVQWPASGIWAVGLYVGIRVMMQGLMLMGLGRTGQEALTHLQDTRIDKLEDLVRAGALALQETQTALAEHTVMMLALGKELHEKISSSDVDPAIKELNQKLGEARKWANEAESATKESWKKVQKDSNAAFKKLQTNIEEASKELKKSLGLDK